jgi:uncharacterized protein
MQILLSPSKTIDFKKAAPADALKDRPLFEEKCDEIMRQMASFSIAEIAHCERVSLKIAQSTYEYIQMYLAERSILKQAVYAYTGNVYAKLRATDFTPSQRQFLEKHLLIFSALYGVLRPFNLIAPYRLDMESKLIEGLYDFWKEKVTEYVLQQVEEDDAIIVNLASVEYFNMLNYKQIIKSNVRVITPVFKQELRGRLVVNSLFAKQARGLMTRFIVENELFDPENIKAFHEEGYLYHGGLSNGNSWVFVR